jgi:hypothetical protein
VERVVAVSNFELIGVPAAADRIVVNVTVEVVAALSLEGIDTVS